jgi:hypothetical protein
MMMKPQRIAMVSVTDEKGLNQPAYPKEWKKYEEENEQ